MKVLFLVNPKAGGKGDQSKIEIANTHFAGAGWSVDTILTESIGHMSELIKTSRENGFELIVIGGGDGTLHEAAQTLASRVNDVPTIPFAIFPLGSGNDLYRGIGAPITPDAAAKNIVDGKPIPVDVGIVEPLNEDGSLRTETPVIFTNTAGIGMDSQTLETREKSPSWLSARYEVCFLMTLAKMYPLSVHLKGDDWEETTDAYWILCCNNRFIGSGMKVAPDAKLDDGLMDVLIIEKMSKLKFIWNLPKVFKGTHLEMQGARIRRTRELFVKSDPIQHMALDGDRFFVTPSRIRILPGAVRLWTSMLVGVEV